jgi:hypothetical protein
MKNAIFWDVTPCVRSVLRVLVTANIAPSSPIPLTLMMEAISLEASVLTRAARHHIPEDGILHIRRENLRYYIVLTGLGL